MFSTNTVIGAIQSTKITATNILIKDKVLNKAALDFIEAQTAFAKMLDINMQNISKYFIDTNTAKWFPLANEKA